MRPRLVITALLAGSLILTPAVLSATTLPATADTSVPVGGPLMGKHLTAVDYSGGAAKLPTISAASWVLADATTGEVLAAKAPHLKHRPASTLKMLTAVTLLPRLTKSTVYMTVDGDVNVEGSRAGIVPNAPYTIDQLFYAMFLPSGNDAATALARAAGSVKSTVAMMNTQARYLQADDTTVVNPTGLDADGQYSSAYDLALIARAALQRPDFRKYIGTLHFQLPGKMPKKGHRRGTFQIGNQDKLLQEGYPGLIGGKTGYTTLAGRTFMAAAQRNGQTLIVTLMGITEPSADAAKSLLDWGFHNLAKTRPVGVLVGHVTPVTATTASPSASAESSSPSTGSPSTSAAAKRSSKGGGGHLGFLPWVGGALVLTGLMVAIRPLFRRRRKGTERDRLLAAVKRWNA
jgi:serine-type D-Ala-D-Ala carboxypeptidase (penicillin-binding protein 5/6)